METNKIYNGDSLEILKTFHDESIDCIITSPPYWNLRDYSMDNQLGLETTFYEYVEKLCNIFDEVKRVLKKDGTCWVNIGDTYSDNKVSNYLKHTTTRIHKKATIQEKSLCQIPSRFSIEMISRGWILRNRLIWYKPNAMPSSAKDRFTVDYEDVFFFVKNRKYYFNTLYEPLSESSINDFNGRKSFRNKGSNNIYACGGEGRDRKEFYNPELGRIKRCVWKINTKPYKEAHFATFPETLIEPMMNAGCPIGGIVLDPFFGAGTTGIVAIKQNKKYIGIELNPEYCKLAEKRISNIPTPMI